MAQTEHLGLHQWEATDSFLRTDFNEDFAKIDGAVLWDKLWAAEITQEAAQLELDLSQRDMGEYFALLLIGRLGSDGVQLRINGGADQVYQNHRYFNGSYFADGAGSGAALGSGGAAWGGCFLDWLVPAGGGVGLFSSNVYWSGSTPTAQHALGMFSDTAWEEITKLTFSGALKPGVRLAVYGLRV